MATPIADMPIEVAQGYLETRYLELGDMAIRYASIPAGTDFGPVLKGLPHDRCPSPHWGIVMEGSLRLEHADGTFETASAGEVYHWPAGHTATSLNGAVFIEVGPVAPMREFHEHALRLFS
ncbi:hypothetical protein IEU95_08345 [Hoyosella rhizosphaerae]|uniref:Cupin domain-containing protein n=1 Tax=Hoyosella rhizosphaerae TaxID=1755582 RepID=A0A916XA25_9ACTN|nr:hypothetical protein [Hoyosella rhizosphaerae]MBN4926838.1 hypothetical protein [Hoyosella rhizosphaerae]GGC56119.1 hypothetical protein GCM10011410_05670 [Hoyosella rhizosphaerae]